MAMNEILDYYKTHTGLNTRKKFKLSQRQLTQLLIENNVTPHSKKESQQLAKLNGDFKAPPNTKGKHHYNDGVRNYTCTEAEAKLHGYSEGYLPMSETKRLTKQTKFEQTNLLKYGDKNYNNRKKSAATTFEHYGEYNITKTTYYHKVASKKYIYDNLSFDSSWELGLYIYAKDHNEPIERAPVSIPYYIEHVKHNYIPDFRYKGELIEIKGDNLIKSGKLIDYQTRKPTKASIAKQKCIEENNVKLLLRKDIKFALDYVKVKYGKDYLKSFKIKDMSLIKEI